MEFVWNDRKCNTYKYLWEENIKKGFNVFFEQEDEPAYIGMEYPHETVITVKEQTGIKYYIGQKETGYIETTFFEQIKKRWGLSFNCECLRKIIQSELDKKLLCYKISCDGVDGKFCGGSK